MGLYSGTNNQAGIIEDGNSRWWQGTTWIADTLAGETVTQDSLLTSATCFACTRALSETVAGLPSMIYRLLDEKREEDPNQSAYELLAEQPNPEMDSFTFFDLMVNRLVNRGNFFAEIQRDSQDRPIALWPIHNSRVRPLRDPDDNSLFWEISNDYTGDAEYSDPTWREQHLHYLSPHNMLNVVGFGSQNGVMAPGMLPAVQEVGIDFATRRYGGGFFKQGAKLAGVVQHPGFINDPGRRDQFRADLNRIHTAEANAHGIGVLWEGAVYNQISISPEQAQFLGTRKWTHLQLCAFYGVPPAIIGDYADSKFATADAMIRAFVMITLRNLVVRLEKALNRQILNVRGEDGRLKRAFSKKIIFQMALDGLLRGDPKTQAETHLLYRNSGILKTNEIREEIGYNPIEGPAGDYLIVNGGMARLDRIDEQGTRDSGAQQQDDQQASLPSFDRERLVQLFEASGLAERPTQVRGADLTEVGIEMAQATVERIHQIAFSQVNRWREQDPAKVQEALAGFWGKQGVRLSEALEPIGGRLLENKVCNALVSKYVDTYGKLDNYQIFDPAQMALFDVPAFIKGEI